MPCAEHLTATTCDQGNGSPEAEPAIFSDRRDHRRFSIQPVPGQSGGIFSSVPVTIASVPRSGECPQYLAAASSLECGNPGLVQEASASNARAAWVLEAAGDGLYYIRNEVRGCGEVYAWVVGVAWPDSTLNRVLHACLFRSAPRRGCGSRYLAVTQTQCTKPYLEGASIGVRLYGKNSAQAKTKWRLQRL